MLFARGEGGQRLFVIPALELDVVRGIANGLDRVLQRGFRRDLGTHDIGHDESAARATVMIPGPQATSSTEPMPSVPKASTNNSVCRWSVIAAAVAKRSACRVETQARP
jgi:hypothetical protein